MFRFRRRVLTYLNSHELELINLGIQVNKANRYLRTVMSNQEVFDAYAAQIAEQNRQIREAVTIIIGEFATVKAAAAAVAEQPLDTAKMDAALEQLTAAVDEVEAIPTPVVDETGPVDGGAAAEAPASE